MTYTRVETVPLIAQLCLSLALPQSKTSDLYSDTSGRRITFRQPEARQVSRLSCRCYLAHRSYYQGQYEDGQLAPGVRVQRTAWRPG